MKVPGRDGRRFERFVPKPRFFLALTFLISGGDPRAALIGGDPGAVCPGRNSDGGSGQEQPR